MAESLFPPWNASCSARRPPIRLADQGRMACFSYIKRWYNLLRPNSALGYPRLLPTNRSTAQQTKRSRISQTLKSSIKPGNPTLARSLEGGDARANLGLTGILGVLFIRYCFCPVQRQIVEACF